MNEEKQSGGFGYWIRTIAIGRHPKRTLLRLILLAAASFVLLKFFLPIRVSGISMSPSYEDGKVNFVNKLAYRWDQPRRGDVVGVRLAGEQVMLLKRIVGLPGEEWEIRDGVVLINGEPLAEPYVKKRNLGWRKSLVTLGPEEYLLIGDNRSMEIELHDFGVARRDQIVGKVLF